MGMYTELQGTILFKNKEIAEAFAFGKEEANNWNHWNEIAKLVVDKSVEDFINFSRSSWIPNGDIYKQEGCIVQFHTELKNYDRTIEKFLTVVLPKIADKWILESKYEELYHWTLHRNNQEDTMVNGDNSYEIDFPFTKEVYTQYPDFDVFDLRDL